MPFQIRELFRTVDEFKKVVIKAMGSKWEEALPRVPLTKEEVKSLLRTRQRRDERKVLGRLAELGSTSAAIITELRLTRETVKEAMRSLQRDRAAQITLATILGATRFRVYHGGRRLATRCSNCRHVEDSFHHLLRCFNLTEDYQTGAQSVDFLTKMAKRAIARSPGTSLPFARDL